MKYLGKKPATPGAVSFKYGEIFDRKKLTQPPLVFGHIWNHSKVDFLGNDQAGDCVWATQAHLLQAMNRGVRRPEVQFSAASVLGDYSACTGYDPAKPETDAGTGMAVAAAYWRKTGIQDANGHRHQIDAYVEINFADVGELMQAAFDFGGIALGINLPRSAEDQFDRHRPWTPLQRSDNLGGHAVALLGRNSHNQAVIATWNGITAADTAFVKAYADEALAYLSLEYLDARGLNPRGFDRDALRVKLAALQH